VSTAEQHKIGSGFGATSTAAEVVAGIDLTGKLAVVTGGYSGIGLETTRALAGAGAHVVVPARRVDTARQALTDDVEVDELDLGDLDSVRAFAQRFLDSGRSIDLLINNAGVMAAPEFRLGPGWEGQFATNHLGHFALANRLWPAVADGARVVALSSRGHLNSPIRWDDMWFQRDGYDKWLAYGQAKTANVLFAVELDRLAGGRQHAFAVHPGGIWTPLQRHLDRQEMIDRGWVDEDGNPVAQWFKSPPQGAATTVWAATSPELAGSGGLYLEDCEVAEPAPDGADLRTVGSGVAGYAVDPAQATRLWGLSAELTGVNAFG
jgi:NAD(P)-dependent dehydrogenase (short-subunit alcohol dehydrogenase family)